jgi:cysteine desulfurase
MVMSTRQIYLDNNATTQPLPEVIQAMEAAMTNASGNPSSAHSRGDAARLVIERSRIAVAQMLGAADDSVVFTSGATEANNLAILSCLPIDPTKGRIVTTTVEHSSVLRLCDYLEDRGTAVVRVPVDSNGLIDLEQLDQSLTSPTSLVSVQWVNNETGVIQPVESIAALASGRGVPFHVDAAQAFGKLRLNVAALPISYLSVTAHKIHGPQGVGALFVRPGCAMRPLLFGGPQESGRRAGTENVPGIAGFGRAAELRSARLPDVAAFVGLLRDSFEQAIATELRDVVINAARAPRVPGSTNILFPDVDGQALVARLDQAGIYCSQSSACTNQRPEPSYVLRAMGLSEEEAYSGVRFSFSEMNTVDEVQLAAEIVIQTVRSLRQFAGAGAFAA